MEESHGTNVYMRTSSFNNNISEVDRGDAADPQGGQSRMTATDFSDRIEGHRWAVSPERTQSLLPPFSAIQLGHLPTPQSPGDLADYLSGSGVSPLSLEHPRPRGHIRDPSSQRPSSRPTSAQSPQTPQRSRPMLAFKNPPFLPAPKDLIESVRPEMNESARPTPSQVATPSPEISRTRRSSILNTPSDSETMLVTPQPTRRSPSHPYTMTKSLAPPPIISPVNSSRSTTYSTSPGLEYDGPRRPKRTSDPCYGIAALVSDHSVQAGLRDQRYFGHDDPFLVRDGEDHGGVLPRKRYPSPPPPPPPKYRQPPTTYTISSAEAESRLENSLTKRVMSPSRHSNPSSHISPFKTEIDDGHYNVSMKPLTSRSTRVIGERRTPVLGPTSPHTPSRVGSAALEPHASASEDSTFTTPPPLSGGEIERIRQRQAMLQETRVVESEKRRPDYLMRIKRSRDSADEEAAQRERENAILGLDVTVSPFRGRRLKLYQPVAVAGSVILEEPAQLDELAEPRTPPPIGTAPTGSIPFQPSTVPSVSMHAIDWRSPRRGGSSPVAWTEDDERKKQKRLQAFAALEPSSKGRRLKPAEVVGQGRVIIDVTSEETRKLAEDGVLQFLQGPRMDSMEDTEVSLMTDHGAEWPDKEYPWSLQKHQRDEYEEAWRRQRLAWIERFLDRESESDEEENDPVAGPSNQKFDSGPMTRSQGGHKRSVSVNLKPNPRQSGILRQMTFSAANTDAREVLLSKKHVRVVAERLRKRRVAEEEEGVVMCICQGVDDGRPMVRCDECRTWYHLICMDIHDESELGDEWYCWKCLPSAEDPAPAPLTEPTFAPAMPESPPRAGVGDQPLYQSALQPSPMPPSPITQWTRDSSPTRRERLPHSLVGDPGDPVRGGPSTPYHSRSMNSGLYSPPKFYDEYGTDDHAPFDPTSTPSRGLKFPNPVPITPRRPHSWTPAPPLSWITPSGYPRTPQFSAQGGSSSTRSLTYSLSSLEDSVGPLTSPWPTDDSPTRKPHRGDSTWSLPTPRRALESPLGVRGADHRIFLPGIEESPTASLPKEQG